MTYKIKFKKDAFKFLENHRELKDKFIDAFTKICINPSNSELDIKKLIGYDDLYRLKIGKYRAIYTIINDELVILVLNIDSRGDIYKKI